MSRDWDDDIGVPPYCPTCGTVLVVSGGAEYCRTCGTGDELPDIEMPPDDLPRIG